MSFLGGIAKSVIRGGVVKGLIKSGVGKLATGVKGLKSSFAKISKGLKQTNIKTVRGLKSGSAQVRALPRAVSQAIADVRYGSMYFPMSTREMLKEFTEQVSYDLAAASKTALKQDAAERIAARLAKTLNNKEKSKVLKKILENAKASETWGEAAIRMGTNVKNQAANLIRGLVREGAENIAIDQTGQILLKGMAAAGGLGTTAATTALVVKKNKKN